MFAPHTSFSVEIRISIISSIHERCCSKLRQIQRNDIAIYFVYKSCFTKRVSVKLSALGFEIVVHDGNKSSSQKFESLLLYICQVSNR